MSFAAALLGRTSKCPARTPLIEQERPFHLGPNGNLWGTLCLLGCDDAYSAGEQA